MFRRKQRTEDVNAAQPEEMAQTPEEELSPEEAEAAAHAQKLSTVVECVRFMGAHKRPVTLKRLAQECDLEEDEAEALLKEAQESEENRDICVYRGQKDAYYYTYPLLAHNYVRAIALSEEKDILHTVATLVRYDSKTYPRPTRVSDFAKEPYGYTKIQVQNAVRSLMKMPEYADIQTYTSAQGTLYIYSTQFLSPVYAKALAENSEDMSLMY